MSGTNRRSNSNILVCGAILIFAFVGFIAPTFAYTEPPASFMNLPMLKKDPFIDRTEQLGISLRQFANKISEGTRFSWKEIDKGQWRLTSEEIDKMTDTKHTGIFLFVPESAGVQLSRVVIDGKEMSKLQIDNFIISTQKEIIKPKKKSR